MLESGYTVKVAGKKPEDKKREPDAVREVRTPNA